MVQAFARNAADLLGAPDSILHRVSTDGSLLRELQDASSGELEPLKGWATVGRITPAHDLGWRNFNLGSKHLNLN